MATQLFLVWAMWTGVGAHVAISGGGDSVVSVVLLVMLELGRGRVLLYLVVVPSLLVVLVDKVLFPSQQALIVMLLPPRAHLLTPTHAPPPGGPVTHAFHLGPFAAQKVPRSSLNSFNVCQLWRAEREPVSFAALSLGPSPGHSTQ